MKAKEAMSVISGGERDSLSVRVSGEMPLLAVLPRLLDSSERRVAVEDEGEVIGEITESSLLEGLGRLIAARDDAAVLTVECAASDFSASGLARAVEAADVHLVDMLTVPASEGNVSVMLRIRSLDSDAAARSLERHGFSVVEREGDEGADLRLAFDRLLELQTILNI